MQHRKLRSRLVLFLGLLAALVVLQVSCTIILFWLLPEDDYSPHHFQLFDFPVHFSTPAREPILPFEEVWSDYRRWHSHDALQRDSNNRTFQVIYYSCPYAAGNLLHDTFNQVIVAVALNRTMLWKYNDPATCNATRKGFGTRICLKSNTESDCAHSLKRASWLPRYDDWKEDLFELSSSSLPVRQPSAYNLSDWFEKPVVALAPLVYQTTAHQLLGSQHTSFLNTNDQSKEIIGKLFSSGSDVLFGMLFRELLPFSHEITPPEYDPTRYSRELDQDHPHRTFVLHSRHFTTDSDGTKTQKERECLRSMLDETDEQAPCTVFLLSDRGATIGILTTYIQSKWKHCTPVVATHVNDGGAGHYIEHGPFAGAGFFQDLMLGSRARDGFIGHCFRSSSQLLRELIQYDRTMEALDKTGGPPSTELPVCCLPSTSSQPHPKKHTGNHTAPEE